MLPQMAIVMLMKVLSLPVAYLVCEALRLLAVT